MTDASGTDWALGIQARSHALLSKARKPQTGMRAVPVRIPVQLMRAATRGHL